MRGLKLERGAGLEPVRVEVAGGATVTVRWQGKRGPWMCTAELDGILVSFALSDKDEAELVVPSGRLKIGYASEVSNSWGETFVEVAAGQTREVVFP